MRLLLPPTLSFGTGVLDELPGVLRGLGMERPLLVSDAGVVAAGAAGRVERLLRDGGAAVELWAEVESDPGEEHADACGRRLAAGAHDGVVAVGGGSVIDVAKVGAVLAGAWRQGGQGTEGSRGRTTADVFGFDRVERPGLPMVAVPTTPCSGAEVSGHAVLWSRELRRKHVVASPRLVPSAAVVDPLLAEALMARRANPLTDAFARLALGGLIEGLPRLHATGAKGGIGAKGDSSAAAREQVVLGSLYAGLAMANASAGAVHALGYPLTDRHGVPHGLANALVAARTLERTWRGRPERAAELAAMLAGAAASAGGAGRVPAAHPDAMAAELPGRLRAFLGSLGVGGSLADWGVGEADLPRLAEEASQYRPVLDNTPLALAAADLQAIYRACWAGGV
jgi:alcohol dehydrogenase class IV